jgi:isopentenyl diphosphate isomerase/L-lactate dehydrogenase-like FMN-dependent dehydrogenase
MGGQGSGSSFFNNITALEKVRLNLRVLHQVRSPKLESDFLGLKLALPVMAAPIGGVNFNMYKDGEETDYTDAVARGCLEAGTVAGLGDGAAPQITAASYATLGKIAGQGILYFKPWDNETVLTKMARLKGLNVPMVGMDVDAAGLITLALMGQPVSPKPVEDLRAIISTLDVPFIAKGIMTPDEAKLALQAGARAIVVSNHGGRVLDHTPGTAEALPAIAAAVKGRLKILVDGGVRSGVDVLKMLALGADAVLIGRPLAIAAIGGGAAGVSRYLRKIKDELASAMIMTGCAGVEDASSRILI